MEYDIAQLRRVAAAITTLQALGCEHPFISYFYNGVRMIVDVKESGAVEFCDGKDFHIFDSLQAIVNAVEA